jgi:hypothetical protein
MMILEIDMQIKHCDNDNQHTFFFCPCPGPDVLTRLRLLITSVFKEIGRGRPCSLRNKPQALQRTEPISSLLHNGVVDVVQFWQVGCERSRSLAVIVAMVLIDDCDRSVAAIRDLKS